MRRTRLALPLVAAAALVAGCGGSSSSSTDAASSPALSPVAQVQAASDATSKAGASKFTLTTSATVAGKEIGLKGEGAVDAAKKLGKITFSIGQQGGAPVSIEERIVGDSLYLALPQQKGTFYKLALKDLVGTSLSSSLDPTAGFGALKAASGDVTEVGKEKVRDTDTTHYRGHYDAKAALDKLDGLAKQVVQATLKNSDLSSVPFDAYIDSDGRIRKLTQSLTVKAAGQDVKTDTTVEAYDFGTAVQVAAPPASQVKDGAAILNGLKGATG